MEWWGSEPAAGLVCTIPRVTSVCGEPGLWDRAELIRAGIGTFPATAPACFSEGSQSCCPQDGLGSALLSSLPCVKRKAHPSPTSSWRGCQGLAWLLQPLWGFGLMAGVWLLVSARFEFLTELSPTSVCQGCKSFPSGIVPPFLSHGDSGVAARLQHLPWGGPTVWTLQEVWRDPMASPFCFCRGRGVLGRGPGQEAAGLCSGGCLGRVSLFGLLKILLCLASPCLHWERELALQDSAPTFSQGWAQRLQTRGPHTQTPAWQEISGLSLLLWAVSWGRSSAEVSDSSWQKLCLCSGLWGKEVPCPAVPAEGSVAPAQTPRGRPGPSRELCPVTVIYLLLLLLPPSPCSSLPRQLRVDVKLHIPFLTVISIFQPWALLPLCPPLPLLKWPVTKQLGMLPSGCTVGVTRRLWGSKGFVLLIFCFRHDTGQVTFALHSEGFLWGLTPVCLFQHTMIWICSSHRCHVDDYFTWSGGVWEQPPGITAGEPALSFASVDSCTPRAEQVQELSQTGLGWKKSRSLLCPSQRAGYSLPRARSSGEGGRGRAVPQPGSASSLLGTAFKGSRVGGSGSPAHRASRESPSRQTEGIGQGGAHVCLEKWCKEAL